MAEDNVGFDPLEELGSNYGNISDEGLDTKSFQPFEGDRIDQHKINFNASDKFYPVFPGMSSLDRPNIQINQAVKSTLTNTPVHKKPGTKDILKAFGEMAVAKAEAGQNRDEVAKMYAYDASPSGNAFYKRYAAYGQEKFDEVGFHPLRDNEANFNARTTKWDDWSRMMNHSFWPLFGQGFASAPQSLAKLMKGDFSSDTGQAEIYEEAAAIGQSSKGGVFGFVNNTALNFGYTAGIIVEAVAEELVGGLLAIPTGGTSLFAATANNAAKIKRVVGGIDEAVDGVKAVSQTVNSLKNVNSARAFWNAAGSKVGRFINPIDNTFDAVQGIKKAKEAGDNITNLAKISRTAGGFYRDVRNLNMALAEGRLEAGMVQNHVYDKLYNEYYAENGEAPTDQEQQYMIQQSKEASANTLLWNTGLIYLSNKITFDNITSPRGGLRNFMKSTVDDIQSVGGGKFGNLGKIVYDKTKKAFEFKKNNLKTLASSWWKEPGFKTAAKTIGYMKGNFSEGIQENLQEVIARVNERYYVDTFSSKGRRSHEYAKGVLAINKGDYWKEELGNEVSMQGLETFASGFVMGMPAGVLNNAMPFLSTSYNRIFDKEGYETYKTNKIKITEGIVDSLNKINIEDFLNARSFNYGAQDIIAGIKQTGTKKEALDAELNSLVDAMQIMVETNTTDVFIDKLKGYGDLTDEEFMDAMPGIDKEDIPKYRTRVENSIAKIERIKKRYDFYNKEKPNPIKASDLEGLDSKSEEFINAVSLQKGWNRAIYNAVYFSESFEDNMNRMVAIQNKFLNNTLLKNTGQTEMSLLFRPDELQGEVDLLKNEIKLLEGLPDKSETDKKKLNAKKKTLSTLSEFKDKHLAFDTFYNRGDYYQSAKAQLKKATGKEPTEEEINKFIDDSLGAQNDEKKQVEVLNDLKVSFHEYLKHIADEGKDTLFDKNVEEGFTLLTDYYKLGVEGREMVKYINTLHDPNNFSDLANRNQIWMKDIYNNRPDYYEGLVKQEIKNIELNALMNKLASRNIYVSEEDLIKFKKEGIIPSEFYDHSVKKVVPKSSPEYALYILYFQQAVNLQEQSDNEDTIANKIYNKELTEKLALLNKEEAEKIAELPTTDVKSNLKEFDKKKKKTVSLKIIADTLADKEYIIAEHIKDKESVKVTYYKDGDKLRYDNAEGAFVIPEENDFKFTSGFTYVITQEADPDRVQEIKNTYAELRKNAVEESKAQPLKADIVSADTPVEEMAPELYNELLTAYSDLIKDNPDYVFENQDDIAFELGLEQYIKTDPEALKIINKYNREKEGLSRTFGTPSTETTEIVDDEIIDEIETPIMSKLFNQELQVEELPVEERQITLKEVNGKIVTYKGKPYQVKKEGVRFILESENSIIELDANEDTTLESLDIDYFQGTYYKPNYKVSIQNEHKATVNDVEYILRTDEKGNIISVSPVNKPEQQIKNAKLLIDIEIARNKYNFKEFIATEKEFTYEEELEELETIDPKAHEKIIQVEGVYNKNWNDTVESALSNLYSKKELSSEEKLALDLWVTDAIINITKLYNKTGDPIYGKALDNLEIINILLYEGNIQQPTETRNDESTKTRYAKPAEPVKKEETGSSEEVVEEETPEEESPEVELTRLVAKKDILNEDNSIFVEQNGTVLVSKTNTKKGTVKLTPIGKKKGKTFNITELDALFILNETVMNSQPVDNQPVDIVTDENKSVITESSNTVQNFMDDIARKNDIENKADKKSIEDIDNDLLNDLDC